jgi:hypothetical protein
VRIARRAEAERPPTEATPERAAARDPFAPVTLPPHGNRAGVRRARRLLVLYLGVLLVLYAAVVLLVVGSPYPGVRDDLVVYAALSVIAAVSAVAGYVLTLGRAPFACYVAGRDLVVRERFGGVRRFPLDGSLRISVRARPAPGLLSPEPTETVRVSSAQNKAREYVLEQGFLEGLPELAGLVAGP